MVVPQVLMYFDGGSKASLYCERPLEKFEGPLQSLNTP